MIRGVLLDLGEVVFRLDFGPLLRHLGFGETSGLARALQIMDSWELYDRFERGGVTEEVFLKDLSQRCARELGGPEFMGVWNSVIVGPVPGVEPLLERIAARLPLYALTNTNPIHLRHLHATYPWLAIFRAIFASHELGARKPEPQAFEVVAQRSGLSPSELLFVDDRPENIEGARRIGMQAELCRQSPGDLLEILTRHRVL